MSLWLRYLMVETRCFTHGFIIIIIIIITTIIIISHSLLLPLHSTAPPVVLHTSLMPFCRYLRACRSCAGPSPVRATTRVLFCFLCANSWKSFSAVCCSLVYSTRMGTCGLLWRRTKARSKPISPVHLLNRAVPRIWICSCKHRDCLQRPGRPVLQKICMISVRRQHMIKWNGEDSLHVQPQWEEKDNKWKWWWWWNTGTASLSRKNCFF